MAIKTSKGKQALFTEINITPLTDIFLVLLIIMMVIAPSFQSMDKNINVPEINSGISIEQKDATVSVTKDGEMFLNGNKISKDNLVAEVSLNLLGNLLLFLSSLLLFTTISVFSNRLLISSPPFRLC